MKYILVLLLILQVGCTGSVIKDDVERDKDYDIVEDMIVDDVVVEYNEDTDVIVIKKPEKIKSTICKHKYDRKRTFVYKDQIKVYHELLFGELVTTYEYTLLTNESHFLSGAEVTNYVCQERN